MPKWSKAIKQRLKAQDHYDIAKNVLIDRMRIRDVAVKYKVSLYVVSKAIRLYGPACFPVEFGIYDRVSCRNYINYGDSDEMPKNK